MTCDGVLSEIKKEYSLVKLLSDKNDSLIMQMRHKRAGRDIVLRKYRICVPAYDFLKGFTHKNLPEIYDTYNCEDGQIVLEEFIGGITVAEVLENGIYTVSGALKIITEYKVAERKDGLALVNVCLLTGRTHQIRAHLAHIGCPVLGDEKYGDNDLNGRYGLRRQCLNACELRFSGLCGELEYLNGRIFKSGLGFSLESFTLKKT